MTEMVRFVLSSSNIPRRLESGRMGPHRVIDVLHLAAGSEHAKTMQDLVTEREKMAGKSFGDAYDDWLQRMKGFLHTIGVEGHEIKKNSGAKITSHIVPAVPEAGKPEMNWKAGYPSWQNLDAAAYRALLEKSVNGDAH